MYNTVIWLVLNTRLTFARWMRSSASVVPMNTPAMTTLGSNINKPAIFTAVETVISMD